MRQHRSVFVISVAMVACVAAWTVARQATAQAPAPGAAGGDAAGGITGVVKETMNAGGYTYVRVDDGSKQTWAAAPETAVAVGDKVAIPNGMPMRDFHSKTLDRTFDVVYFVPAIQVVGKGTGGAPAAAAHGMGAHGAAGHAAAADGMPGHSAAAEKTTVDLTDIRKADGGQTVAELFDNKAALVGKAVVVRGRVVKFTASVMGKNWLHLRDGSGSAGTNDLTVSTNATAAIGDMVLVRGTLGADKDLGFGYHYDIIIEDAAVTVE